MQDQTQIQSPAGPFRPEHHPRPEDAHHGFHGGYPHGGYYPGGGAGSLLPLLALTPLLYQHSYYPYPYPVPVPAPVPTPVPAPYYPTYNPYYPTPYYGTTPYPYPGAPIV